MADQNMPQSGTPEWDAAMAAKFEAHQAGEGAVPPAEEQNGNNGQQPPAKPVGLPDKFWDPKTGKVDYGSLIKSYGELEKKLSEKPQPKESQQQEAPEGEQPPSQEQASEQLSQKGLDLKAFTQEFLDNGELSEESYKKLESAGITRDVVDGYIAGQMALASQRDAVGFEAAGGEEKFQQMAEWAKTALTPAERKLFNETVAKGSIDQIKFAVAGLRAQYEAANGREPGLVGGGNSNNAQGGFRSHAEMIAAMQDPRYKKDPAYRKDVEQRTALSNFW